MQEFTQQAILIVVEFVFDDRIIKQGTFSLLVRLI
jgi:hypothetical protein